MQQVIAELIKPQVPSVVIRRVRTVEDWSYGYFCLTVPRSAMAPHAVVFHPRPALGYPARSGRRTVWLAEWQIAERYRGRFFLARAQVASLESLVKAGQANPQFGDAAWLCAALVPELTADRRLDRQFLNDVKEFGERWSDDLPTLDRPFLGDLRPGRRRVRVSSESSSFELHTSGAAFGGMLIGPTHAVDQTIRVDITRIELAALVLTDLLAKYATWVGAGGDAAIAAYIKTAKKIQLTHQGFLDLRAANETSDAGPVELTVPIEAIAADAKELVSVASALASDFLADFGIVESPVLRPDGFVNVQAVDPYRQDQLRR
jgi:hypothetical protein